MLGAFVNAFRTPDLRTQAAVRPAHHRDLPARLADPDAGRRTCQGPGLHHAGENDGIYGLINLFSGGALLQLTVFALGIMPYITASIILQLLIVVIPRLETLKKEGQAGQPRSPSTPATSPSRLAILQSTGIVGAGPRRPALQGCTRPLLYNDDSLTTMLVMVITMTAGTAVIMWLGELITDRGIGNGMSILIFTQVVATFPASLWAIKTKGWGVFALVMAIGLVIMAAVIFMEQGQRRIPVQYARRMVGRKMFGGSSTYIPLKVNQAGVIPVIFASSLLYLPALATQFDAATRSWSGWIRRTWSRATTRSTCCCTSG